jgi:hypothetical protein
MSKRPKIPTQVELDVINQSGRRCCMCFALSADFEEKQGQIAHLDHDRTNNRPSNLAWLCLPHHDQYDSRTSQSKGYSEKEVKRYRNELHDHIAKWRQDTLKSDDIFTQTIQKFLDENIPLIFFAALATTDPILRQYMLKEISDPLLKEKLINVWAFLDSPADDNLDQKLTNSDLMVYDISKTGDVGKTDLNNILGLATEALLQKPEKKRVEALLAIKGNKLREGLMVLLQVGLRMIQEARGENLG